MTTDAFGLWKLRDMGHVNSDEERERTTNANTKIGERLHQPPLPPLPPSSRPSLLEGQRVGRHQRISSLHFCAVLVTSSHSSELSDKSVKAGLGNGEAKTGSFVTTISEL